MWRGGAAAVSLLVDWIGLLWLTGRRTQADVLLVRAGLATTVSQAAWWTAVVVGFLNSRP